MKRLERLADYIFKFLCSLKLAVIVIIALGTISAVGTVVESKYDMLTAQQLVYHSPYMYFTMALLCINLIAVAVDRLPWRKRHVGFVMAHAGIIILILGSYVTRKLGVDGSISMNIGETSRSIAITETDLIVYRLQDMQSSEKIFAQDVNFLVRSPKKHPLQIVFGESEKDQLEIVDYMPYAKKDFAIRESDKMTDGPAVRFQLQNPMINMTEWIVQSGTQPAKLDLGPAQVVLAKTEYKTLGGKNEIALVPTNTKDVFRYTIFDKEGKIEKSGTVPVGGVLETGWMGLTLRVIQAYPKARVDYTYTRLDYPNPTSTSAALVKFNGNEHWLGKNSAIQLFTDDSVYFVTYGNKRIDMGFNMTLEKFIVDRYEGTNMAKGYKSLVYVPELGQREIWMNEPLKHNGYTFYQSSFEENKMGDPVASILSVNYDPGRWIKYLGSALIILGSIMLFYFRKFGIQPKGDSKFLKLDEDKK